MKTLRSVHSQSENEQNLINRFQKDLFHTISLAKKALFTLFVLFAFHSVSLGQTAMVNTKSSIHKDKQELKQEKAALRAEKEVKTEVKELNDIPDITMSKFKSEFPKATDVSWMVPDNYIEAQFQVGNKKKVAFYNWKNELLGSGQYVAYSRLPESARKYIAKHNKGYQPVQTMWYDDNEDVDESLNLWDLPFDEDSYFVQLKKGDKTEVLQVDLDGEVSYWGGN